MILTFTYTCFYIYVLVDTYIFKIKNVNQYINHNHASFKSIYTFRLTKFYVM